MPTLEQDKAEFLAFIEKMVKKIEHISDDQVRFEFAATTFMVQTFAPEVARMAEVFVGGMLREREAKANV